jgi:hypothetical protein
MPVHVYILSGSVADTDITVPVQYRYGSDISSAMHWTVLRIESRRRFFHCFRTYLITAT